MSCKECKHARKAFVDGKVGCSLLSRAKHFGVYPDKPRCPNCGEYLGTTINFDEFMDTVKFNKDEIYEGWSNLGLKPNSKSTEGMMTNSCYILDEDNSCNYFEVNYDN